MKVIGGEIFTDNEIIPGYITLSKDKLAIEYGKPSLTPVKKGIIIPSLINCHTHIGDSFIKNRNVPLIKDIKKLVAPPNGIKHRMLKHASKKEILAGMERSVEIMIKTGTTFFWDFREGGLEGIKLLNQAINSKKIKCLRMSRPKNLKYELSELKVLIQESNGIGLSSISDWDYSQIQKISKYTRSHGKIFALHASERIREDIDLILDLKPDYLIHMNKATLSDLKVVKENNIPIVICPRSNDFFGLKTNYQLIYELGINMMLGTDNAMINNPNILEEIKFLKAKYNNMDLYDLIKMVTYNPRKVLNLECNIPQIKSINEIIILDRDLNMIYNPLD